MRATFFRWGLAVFVVFGVLAPVRPASALDGPNITVNDVLVSEGDVGPAVITIPVDLSTPSNSIVTVQYTIVGDPTGAGDIATRTGTLTFRVGVTERLIKVTVYGDTTLEGNGDAQIQLSAPVHAQIEDGVGEVLVRDDDSNSTSNAVSIGDATVIEADSGTRYAYVPVTLSAPPAFGTTVKVQVISACGSAAPAASSQAITFRAGVRAKMLKYAIAGDTTPEHTQVAYKQLKLKLGNAVISVPTGAVTIDDNDGGSNTEPPPWGDSELISQSSDGQLAAYPPDTCGVYPASPTSISADGDHVAFVSGATNLAPNDTNKRPDVFVRDRSTGTTERVDVTNDGSELSDGGGGPGYVSDDGNFVSFTARSPELSPTGVYQAFVRDRAGGTTTLVGILPDGTTAAHATVTGISPDGRYVPFVAPNPSTGTTDIYLRDLATSSTQWIAPSWSGWDRTPMTDTGEIAFVSSSSTLVPDDTNGYPDVFVENIATGAVDRVNLTNAGAQESGNTFAGNPNAARVAISRDGRYVVFWSASANMGVPPNESRVFLRDRVAGTTELESIIPTNLPLCYSQNEGVSNDGRYVSFSALCETADTTPVLWATMVRDRLLGTTTRVDALPDGTPGNLDGGHASVMSADGKWVAYESSADNLMAGDTNFMADVFIRKIS